jgi:hypothetical protein
MTWQEVCVCVVGGTEGWREGAVTARVCKYVCESSKLQSVFSFFASKRIHKHYTTKNKISR